MLGLGKKNLTRGEIDILSAVYTLVHDGEIPFRELEPIYKNHSKIIVDFINEIHEEERQREITCMKLEIESHKSDIERIKQALDKCNSTIVEMKAELEDLNKKEKYARDEDRIKNLLYWIFNNENDSERLRDEIANKEAHLKTMEDELLKKEENK